MGACSHSSKASQPGLQHVMAHPPVICMSTTTANTCTHAKLRGGREACGGTSRAAASGERPAGPRSCRSPCKRVAEPALPVQQRTCMFSKLRASSKGCAAPATAAAAGHIARSPLTGARMASGCKAIQGGRK